MSELIYPRSPREMMAGWVYLPRFVDKIRLHLAGKLHPDYQDNFTKGFDGFWLKTSGVSAETFIAIVKETITDGQVTDWIVNTVKKSDSEKALFRESILNRGRNDDTTPRLKMRKEQGLGLRDDIQTFVDFIDADEKRM